jgi:hypothetical protein
MSFYCTVYHWEYLQKRSKFLEIFPLNQCYTVDPDPVKSGLFARINFTVYAILCSKVI